MNKLPKHWAYWNKRCKPWYSLYIFIGYDASSGLYWFRARRAEFKFSRNYYQLLEGMQAGSFLPFLIEGGKQCHFTPITA